MKPSKLIQAYVIRNYGNIITPSKATFDEGSKTWVAELKANYPRIIQDDERPTERILKFIAMRQLGKVIISEDGMVNGTPRSECVNIIDTLLNRWHQHAEKIVRSVSANNLARIGMVKDALNPIVMIISNFLREGKEVISDDEIEKEPRPNRMRQYFRFLEEISLIEKTRDGYTYAPLFVELRKKSGTDEDFKSLVIGYVIRNHYSTIKEVFAIWRFEPFVHTENCYYSPTLEAEKMLGRKEDSLMGQYYRWYGKMSQMRLRTILDELVRVDVLERERGFYYGKKDLWQEMLNLKHQMPVELSPLRG